MSKDVLLLEKSMGIALLTINRPPKSFKQPGIS